MATQANLIDQKYLWTDDDTIAFECAQDAIGDMIMLCSQLLHEERNKNNANVNRINEIEEKRNNFVQERLNLHWYEKEKINKIFNDYGDKIRKYDESGDCPV